MRRRYRKAALAVPGLRRVLLEKRELEKRVHSQDLQLKELVKRNEDLNKKIANQQTPKPAIWPLLQKEIIKAELNSEKTESPGSKHKPPYTLNWMVPAVTATSGGQTDIYRTVSFLTNKGYKCRVYIFDPEAKSNVAEQKAAIAVNFPELKSDIFYNTLNIADCDAIFATHWLTAYPVYNFRGKGKKYYYAQGYEPHTQPMGYFSYLAEQTYSFGFRGIVLGQWLQEKLSREYKMHCDYFDYGYDPNEYFVKSKKVRKDILYYAQPQKAHRGFELGMMALELFHAKNPVSKIHLFGAELNRYKIPFPFEDHGTLSVHQLNDLYNKCAAGLALSFTNISLIPLEMIAAGCMPVVNDSNHTRKIKYAAMVRYAAPNPQAIADVLSTAVKSSVPTVELSQSYTWDHSNQKIENILIKDLS